MILRTEGLAKTFEVGFRRRRVQAVRDLTLSVQEGEIFGFVGPNGAGKTTTIKMLMGLIFPSGGRAFIFDAPIPSTASKARIGYLPENPAYYEFLTGREALRFFARLARVPGADAKRRCDELLELVGLTPAADRQIRKYSKGMQQRLGIAQALVADPAFVILDEPMSGLDPIGRKEVRDLILELKRRGKTVFFSTHILPDVESLCDRVGIIMRGQLRDVGRLGELLSPRVKTVELSAMVPEGARGALARGRVLAEEGERVSVAFDDEASADGAVRAVLAAGGRLVALTPHRETLEDFFMRRLQEGEARPEATPRRLAAP
ncbi:ABC transporter ATP-binding protein [Anaeromyxobacter diazotrophicus]|uniref:ABC transporter ATP-binding protein n=1 Tax=Anaeromyxobacter diazotrophicus TaxID=2590199 RepID=A0A7I9VH36_9BACT|nr:ABC transporter ATP-binding protein [Anaeromyxobacter diazotrophicus]GEJ55655.1 ABC transporter ATP-binding protein [Anaeromyxobacter diazotrophicus]